MRSKHYILLDANSPDGNEFFLRMRDISKLLNNLRIRSYSVFFKKGIALIEFSIYFLKLVNDSPASAAQGLLEVVLNLTSSVEG